MRHEPAGHVTTCPVHGKRLYSSRDRAKAAIRAMAGKGMRAYRCTEVDGNWHVGHLPAVVRHGLMTADEVYGEAS